MHHILCGDIAGQLRGPGDGATRACLRGADPASALQNPTRPCICSPELTSTRLFQVDRLKRKIQDWEANPVPRKRKPKRDLRDLEE